MKMEKTKQIKIRDNYEFGKLTQLAEMASILKSHIVKHRLFTNIAGKNYVMVEGWQFAGGLLGLHPRIVVKELGENRWMSKTEIVDKNEKVMSVGYATCSKAEEKKKSFDDYAILSMAQTRSLGKAYRNLIGYVMKMASYETTPAEEMTTKIISTETKTKEHIGEDIDPKPSIAKLKKAKTQSELRRIWQSLSATERLNPDVIDFKNNLKTQIK